MNNLFEICNLESSKIEELKVILPKNVMNTRPITGRPLRASKKVLSVAVMTKYEEERKFTYLINSETAKLLPKSAYQVKDLFTTYDEFGSIRFLILSSESNNTWQRSLRESITLAQSTTIELKTDHEAKVYVYHQKEGAILEEPSSESISEQFQQTFDEFYIDTPEHPLIREKSGKHVVVVDEGITDDVDTKPTQLQAALEVESDKEPDLFEGEFDNLTVEVPEFDFGELNIDDLDL